jgi:hypothetical protein
MNQIVNQHSAFLDTSSKAALSQWDDLLRLQVDLFFPQERAYLGTFAPWQAARHVLESAAATATISRSFNRRFRRNRTSESIFRGS